MKNRSFDLRKFLVTAKTQISEITLDLPILLLYSSVFRNASSAYTMANKLLKVLENATLKDKFLDLVRISENIKSTVSKHLKSEQMIKDVENDLNVLVILKNLFEANWMEPCPTVSLVQHPFQESWLLRKYLKQPKCVW